jgi:hypothetical protein
MIGCMEMREVDADELVEFWTLLDEDRGLLAGKRGATALGCALLLKYYSRSPSRGADGCRSGSSFFRPGPPPVCSARSWSAGRARSGQRHDEERHGRETGRIVMNPEGGYTEINEPAQRVALLGSDRGRTR